MEQDEIKNTSKEELATENKSEVKTDVEASKKVSEEKKESFGTKVKNYFKSVREDKDTRVRFIFIVVAVILILAFLGVLIWGLTTCSIKTNEKDKNKPVSDVKVSIFADKSASTYSLLGDYEITQEDIDVLGQENGELLIDHACVLNLAGKQLDLGGRVLVIRAQSPLDKIIVKDGDIVNGSIRIEAGQADVELNNVVFDSNVACAIEAEESEVTIANMAFDPSDINALGGTLKLSNAEITGVLDLTSDLVADEKTTITELNIAKLAGIPDEEQPVFSISFDNTDVGSISIKADTELNGKVNTKAKVLESAKLKINKKAEITEVAVESADAGLEQLNTATIGNLTISASSQDVVLGGAVDKFDLDGTAKVTVRECSIIGEMAVNAAAEVTFNGTVSNIEIKDAAEVVFGTESYVQDLVIEEDANITLDGKVAVIEVNSSTAQLDVKRDGDIGVIVKTIENENIKININAKVNEQIELDDQSSQDEIDAAKERANEYKDKFVMPVEYIEPECQTEQTEGKGKITYKEGGNIDNGKQTQEEEIEAKDHVYKFRIVKEATTTEEGIGEYYCEDCGDSYQIEIPMRREIVDINNISELIGLFLPDKELNYELPANSEYVLSFDQVNELIDTITGILGNEKLLGAIEPFGLSGYALDLIDKLEDLLQQSGEFNVGLIREMGIHLTIKDNKLYGKLTVDLAYFAGIQGELEGGKLVAPALSKLTNDKASYHFYLDVAYTNDTLYIKYDNNDANCFVKKDIIEIQDYINGYIDEAGSPINLDDLFGLYNTVNRIDAFVSNYQYSISLFLDTLTERLEKIVEPYDVSAVDVLAEDGRTVYTLNLDKLYDTLNEIGNTTLLDVFNEELGAGVLSSILDIAAELPTMTIDEVVNGIMTIAQEYGVDKNILFDDVNFVIETFIDKIDFDMFGSGMDEKVTEAANKYFGRREGDDISTPKYDIRRGLNEYGDTEVYELIFGFEPEYNYEANKELYETEDEYAAAYLTSEEYTAYYNKRIDILGGMVGGIYKEGKFEKILTTIDETLASTLSELFNDGCEYIYDNAQELSEFDATEVLPEPIAPYGEYINSAIQAVVGVVEKLDEFRSVRTGDLMVYEGILDVIDEYAGKVAFTATIVDETGVIESLEAKYIDGSKNFLLNIVDDRVTKIKLEGFGVDMTYTDSEEIFAINIEDASSEFHFEILKDEEGEISTVTGSFVDTYSSVSSFSDKYWEEQVLTVAFMAFDTEEYGLDVAIDAFKTIDIYLLEPGEEYNEEEDANVVHDKRTYLHFIHGMNESNELEQDLFIDISTSQILISCEEDEATEGLYHFHMESAFTPVIEIEFQKPVLVDDEDPLQTMSGYIDVMDGLLAVDYITYQNVDEVTGEELTVTHHRVVIMGDYTIVAIKNQNNEDENAYTVLFDVMEGMFTADLVSAYDDVFDDYKVTLSTETTAIPMVGMLEVYYSHYNETDINVIGVELVDFDVTLEYTFGTDESVEFNRLTGKYGENIEVTVTEYKDGKIVATYTDGEMNVEVEYKDGDVNVEYTTELSEINVAYKTVEEVEYLTFEYNGYYEDLEDVTSLSFSTSKSDAGLTADFGFENFGFISSEEDEDTKEEKKTFVTVLDYIHVDGAVDYKEVEDATLEPTNQIAGIDFGFEFLAAYANVKEPFSIDFNYDDNGSGWTINAASNNICQVNSERENEFEATLTTIYKEENEESTDKEIDSIGLTVKYGDDLEDCFMVETGYATTLTGWTVNANAYNITDFIGRDGIEYRDNFESNIQGFVDQETDEFQNVIINARYYDVEEDALTLNGNIADNGDNWGIDGTVRNLALIAAKWSNVVTLSGNVNFDEEDKLKNIEINYFNDEYDEKNEDYGKSVTIDILVDASQISFKYDGWEDINVNLKMKDGYTFGDFRYDYKNVGELSHPSFDELLSIRSPETAYNFLNYVYTYLYTHCNLWSMGDFFNIIEDSKIGIIEYRHERVDWSKVIDWNIEEQTLFYGFSSARSDEQEKAYLNADPTRADYSSVLTNSSFYYNFHEWDYSNIEVVDGMYTGHIRITDFYWNGEEYKGCTNPNRDDGNILYIQEFKDTTTGEVIGIDIKDRPNERSRHLGDVDIHYEYAKHIEIVEYDHVAKVDIDEETLRPYDRIIVDVGEKYAHAEYEYYKLVYDVNEKKLLDTYKWSKLFTLDVEEDGFAIFSYDNSYNQYSNFVPNGFATPSNLDFGYELKDGNLTVGYVRYNNKVPNGYYFEKLFTWITDENDPEKASVSYRDYETDSSNKLYLDYEIAFDVILKDDSTSVIYNNPFGISEDPYIARDGFTVTENITGIIYHDTPKLWATLRGLGYEINSFGTDVAVFEYVEEYLQVMLEEVVENSTFLTYINSLLRAINNTSNIDYVIKVPEELVIVPIPHEGQFKIMDDYAVFEYNKAHNVGGWNFRDRIVFEYPETTVVTENEEEGITTTEYDRGNKLYYENVFYTKNGEEIVANRNTVGKYGYVEIFSNEYGYTYVEEQVDEDTIESYYSEIYYKDLYLGKSEFVIFDYEYDNDEKASTMSLEFDETYYVDLAVGDKATESETDSSIKNVRFVDATIKMRKLSGQDVFDIYTLRLDEDMTRAYDEDDNLTVCKDVVECTITMPDKDGKIVTYNAKVDEALYLTYDEEGNVVAVKDVAKVYYDGVKYADITIEVSEDTISASVTVVDVVTISYAYTSTDVYTSEVLAVGFGGVTYKIEKINTTEEDGTLTQTYRVSAYRMNQATEVKEIIWAVETNEAILNVYDEEGNFVADYYDINASYTYGDYTSTIVFGSYLNLDDQEGSLADMVINEEDYISLR